MNTCTHTFGIIQDICWVMATLRVIDSSLITSVIVQCMCICMHVHLCVCACVCKLDYICKMKNDLYLIVSIRCSTTRHMLLGTRIAKHAYSKQDIHSCIHTYTHTFIHHLTQIHSYIIYLYLGLQGGEDSQDALSCKSFFAKQPLIIGLFCGKWTTQIRQAVTLCHPVSIISCLLPQYLMTLARTHMTLRNEVCIHVNLLNASETWGMYSYWVNLLNASTHIHTFTTTRVQPTTYVPKLLYTRTHVQT